MFTKGTFSIFLLYILNYCKQVSSLKGHCNAIWQLYKKLEGVFASTESQT